MTSFLTKTSSREELNKPLWTKICNEIGSRSLDPPLYMDFMAVGYLTTESVTAIIVGHEPSQIANSSFYFIVK